MLSVGSFFSLPFSGSTVAHLISRQCRGLIEVREIKKRLTNGRRRCREAAKDGKRLREMGGRIRKTDNA